MALKYPNKCKRAGYWPAYEQARINDFRIVWQEICHTLPATGRKACGRPPNLTLHELYCLCVFSTAFDRTLRELEADCEVLLQKSLDHTNLSRWFSRLDECVLDAALVALHERMAAGRRIEYITDSTPFTLSTLRSTIKGGSPVLEFTTWKLHALLAYLPVLGLLSVVSVHATHGDANDSPPFRNCVLPKAHVRAGCRLHADKAYYTLEILRAVRAKGLRPNIVPHAGRWHGHTFRRARDEYNNEARKKYRGLVEGFFGGLATRQGTKCRFKKPKSKNIFCHAITLAQQVRTYLRYKVLALYLLFRTNPARAVRGPPGGEPMTTALDISKLRQQNEQSNKEELEHVRAEAKGRGLAGELLIENYVKENYRPYTLGKSIIQHLSEILETAKKEGRDKVLIG